ncbi:hypothetical protein [Methylosinus sp. Sm6]|uniref:hypothetical protein n=1 Tax=Methylosinus sp. Sm6 TaxID=2866948 RepID=UPI001C99CF32|nr:hypothetical protein [Methylosinus sp. Sm6]MBY6241722.1 hypothetical protein [Methylosinus sp. Sm6]
MLGRDKIAQAAKELAEHLQVIETIKSLQESQKKLADAVNALDQRLRSLEVELKVVRADVRVDALRETQNIVNSVQGGLNQRIEDLAIKVAVMERGAHRPSPVDASVPLILGRDATAPGDGA